MWRVAPAPERQPPFYSAASDWRFATLHVIIIRPIREAEGVGGDIKPIREEVMKQSLMNVLAETGKVSCLAALLLCVGSAQASEPKYKVATGPRSNASQR